MVCLSGHYKLVWLWSTMLDLIYTGKRSMDFLRKSLAKNRFMKNRHVAFSKEDPLILPDRQGSGSGFRKQLN
jgi:hypothetical protein